MNSDFLRDADSISVFTPVLLTNILIDLQEKNRESEFAREVYQKYSRCSPESQKVIDKLMQERKTEYLKIQNGLGETAYQVFIRVKSELAGDIGDIGQMTNTFYIEVQKALLSQI
jgi:hypothetical protein